MVNHLKLISLYVAGKTNFSITVCYFSGFSVIFGYCITDVGFGFVYKTTYTFGCYSVNQPSLKQDPRVHT